MNVRSVQAPARRPISVVPPGNRTKRTSRAPTRAMLQFFAAGLAALAVVGLGGAFALRHAGESEALADARQLTRTTGRFVEPAVTDALLREDPTELATIDAIVRSAALREPIIRVKIWAGDGRIVYSDEPRLIGSTYTLGSDEQRVLHSNAIESDITDLTRPENRFDRAARKLLEVYMPIHTTGGTPLLYETYQRYSAVSAGGRRVWFAFAPTLIVALLVLELSQLPLARSLARRVQEAQRQREAALQRAVKASETERRRVAADLHDGVVQELAGVSYALASVERELSPRTRASVREALREAAAATRQCMRELRTLLVDIYPPNLQRTGLGAALADLAASGAGRGIETTARVADGLALPPHIESLLYRAAQEAFRNAIKHSGATEVTIDVGSENRRAMLVVRDNGRGFDGTEPGVEDPQQQHFGLRLIRELAEEAGGRASVESSPDSGTTVRVEVSLT